MWNIAKMPDNLCPSPLAGSFRESFAGFLAGHMQLTVSRHACAAGFPARRFERIALDNPRHFNQIVAMAKTNKRSGAPPAAPSAPRGCPPRVVRICSAHGNDEMRLIEILHDVQEQKGSIREADLAGIARCLNLSQAEVAGVASFYDDFRLAGPESEDATGGRAREEIRIRICRGEACQSVGAGELFALAQRLAGEHEHIRVSAVYCLGNCALSPALQVNGELKARADRKLIEQLTGAPPE